MRTKLRARWKSTKCVRALSRSDDIRTTHNNRIYLVWLNPYVHKTYVGFYPYRIFSQKMYFITFQKNKKNENVNVCAAPNIRRRTAKNVNNQICVYIARAHLKWVSSRFIIIIINIYWWVGAHVPNVYNKLCIYGFV